MMDLWPMQDLTKRLIKSEARVSELQSERNELLRLSMSIAEHPEDYDGPCWCKLCISYMKDDSDL